MTYLVSTFIILSNKSGGISSYTLSAGVSNLEGGALSVNVSITGDGGLIGEAGGVVELYKDDLYAVPESATPGEGPYSVLTSLDNFSLHWGDPVKGVGTNLLRGFFDMVKSLGCESAVGTALDVRTGTDPLPFYRRVPEIFEGFGKKVGLSWHYQDCSDWFRFDLSEYSGSCFRFDN